MTCIVGIRTKTGVLLGADSLATTGNMGLTRADSKLFTLTDQVAIGFSGSYRLGQVLAHHVKVPDPLIGDGVREWAITRFVPEVRQRLKDAGAMRWQDGQEHGVVFLLAAFGRLLRVNADFQVVESTHAYAACGSGEPWALGALLALHASAAEADERLRLEVALEAAEEFCIDCRGPFTFVETRGN